MIDVREAKYPWGLPVSAQVDLFNDGSYPDQPGDARLVAQGEPGEIVQIGHHTEANVPIYLVEFVNGFVVGCLEEEIAPRQPAGAPRAAADAGA